MRRAALVALLLMLSAGAHAQVGNQRAEAEARSYLLPCPSTLPLCANEQKQFVDSYILAEAGATYFMGDIIGFLDPLQPALHPYMKRDRVKACVWRYLRWKVSRVPAFEDVYRRDWSARCVGPADIDEAKQKSGITSLINDLKTSPAELTPALAIIVDRYAPEEPLAAALIEKTLPAGY